MAKKLNLDLPNADDLFSTQEERDDNKREKIYDISISKIDEFPNHPFSVNVDEDMLKLAESIKSVGVQTPVICRKKDNGRYELISGHRRKKACELAGIEMIPVIVREMSRDEAVIFMVDSNLQREKILPSEKAFSYKMKLEAMKRQGKRTDLTSTPVVGKLRGKESTEILGEESGDSREQVRRYIKLTELMPEILDMVDEGKIAFRPAVEISSLAKEKQKALIDTMESEDCTPSLAQTQKMRKFDQDNKLTDEVILSILSEEKPNQIEHFKIPRNRIDKFFSLDTPKEKIEDTIVDALNEHMKRKRSKDMER